jgi:hypothetical protein
MNFSKTYVKKITSIKVSELNTIFSRDLKFVYKQMGDILSIYYDGYSKEFIYFKK